MSKKKESTKISKASKRLDEYCGYKIVPVIVKDRCRHYLYMKKHVLRSSSELAATDRTLFIVNLPADATDDHLKHLFSAYGRIQRIIYHNRPSSFGLTDGNSDSEDELPAVVIPSKTSLKNRKRKAGKEQPETSETRLQTILHSGASAHVVFDSPKDLKSVLEMPRVELKWMTDKKATVPVLGFERYVLSYNLARPDAQQLQQQVDSFMLKFKASEYEKEREVLERMNKMDEDGFVVVTRHKKAKTTDGSISVAAVSADSIDLQKAQQRELFDFYRFQVREKKQNELIELRKRFEDDKQKIAKLKQSRKFKPF
ncbi:Ribosomal RNA-processing protein 7 A [Apophysomyces sp. BC1034]|nr:Ribosomal RNA-processing protein 7 A [Apophysomyces sp. BC1015]KAG0177298.1 Ribosomal RNA-processing protein 7 A [Apophysomyces sp. BC1021]KAG0187560.1 Ribosomal RNA-processing protein 7 A [Apophysomyces sp. BC1034]